MSRPSSSRTSLHLEPPRKSIELEDPGAHELSSEGEDEHFSDASEGQKRPSRPVTPVSPIPRTRIEKVDDEPRYGEVPGTPAYEKRMVDAVPDEVEVVHEGHGRLSKRSSQFLEPPTTPGGTLIPRTVVEKIDPESPSYGDVPKTSGYLQRQMDAVPDVILKTPTPGRKLNFSREEDEGRPRSNSDIPVPETIITRVDSIPAHGEVPGMEAAKKRKLDAAPEIIEKRGDVEAGNSSV